MINMILKKELNEIRNKLKEYKIDENMNIQKAINKLSNNLDKNEIFSVGVLFGTARILKSLIKK